MKKLLPLLALLCSTLYAEDFNVRDFARSWTIESESPNYRIEFFNGATGDTLEVISPKGMTIWYNRPLSGSVRIEYDACVMLEEGRSEDRLSDLNCFWMATDPSVADGNVLTRLNERKGIFLNSYALRLYYMGYGGNSNTTTRFRRYSGDARGVTDARFRPAILKEYADTSHLNVANRWRHICLTADPQGHVTYEMDGEPLIDFRDASPLASGWFGFRTTWSRIRFANFKVTEIPALSEERVELQRVDTLPAGQGLALPVHFGVPFSPGSVEKDTRFALADGDGLCPIDFYPLAYYADGSVKWGGFSGAFPSSCQRPTLVRANVTAQRPTLVRTKATASKTARAGKANLDKRNVRWYWPTQSGGTNWSDSVTMGGVCVMRNASLRMSFADGSVASLIVDSVCVEREGEQHRVIRVDGHCETSIHIFRLLTTDGSDVLELTHTFVNARKDEAPMIRSMEIVADIPLREAHYNRHVAFVGDGRVWHESVQGLSGRRELPDGIYVRQMQGERIPELTDLTNTAQALIRDWATWDRFRLTQLHDMGFTIRKSAKPADQTPWIGLYGGHRADGAAFVGDVSGGLILGQLDFWQSYPSSVGVEGMTSDCATLRLQLWSEEAGPMDLRHYDTEAHGLEASYEDIQPGMSTPYGIARTTRIQFLPVGTYPGDERMKELGLLLCSDNALLPKPEYLYAQRAFGIWSLPSANDSIESQLRYLNDFYLNEIDKRHWYGFWNYGDVMHAYDPIRDEWRYDVGGFAWDNTELASNAMLWYSFLRTGRADLWRAAVAMTRHTSEVDVYHLGPYAGLGTRHNVSHWGCGAKEARISEAFWNRFYYYLSGGDLRMGELMTAVRDLDTLLYTLDPMRLAQPRSLYPCTTPARLRIGPDWLAYVSNWYAEWERTRDESYLRKILTGMHSINHLPHRIFTGPKALGYDPATGIITSEVDTTITNTNHLMPLMGGFEMMNEILYQLGREEQSLSRIILADGTTGDRVFAEWKESWLDYCLNYRRRDSGSSRFGFPIPRLHGYAYYNNIQDPIRRKMSREDAWIELDRESQHYPHRFSTNGTACWTLDAIYLLEVCP